MLISWANRAEIAVLSLDDRNSSRVRSAIDHLRDVPPKGFARVPEIKAMAGSDGKRFFAYDVGDAMRLIFTVSTDGIMIEDIAPKSRIERVA